MGKKERVDLIHDGSDLVMSKFEKKKLLGDANARSLANPKDVHYILYGGCFGFVTTDAEKAKIWMSQGYKLYCKMLDGQMIL